MELPFKKLMAKLIKNVFFNKCPRKYLKKMNDVTVELLLFLANGKKREMMQLSSLLSAVHTHMMNINQEDKFIYAIFLKRERLPDILTIFI